MVNTFLVVADFRKSAKYLSRAHLGKQRVEAMQIRNSLFDLTWLSWYFEVDIPPRGADKDTIYNWAGEIQALIKEIPYRFIARATGDVEAVCMDHNLFKMADNEIFTISGDEVIISKKSGRGNSDRVKKSEFLFPGDHEIGVGLRKHPVLFLWHTYIPALEIYINVHIDEWLERGYRNTMIRYPVKPDTEYPKWVVDPEFHRTMRARLREKELTWIQEQEDGKRKSVEIWYSTNPFFLEAGKDTGYLW